MSVPHKTGATDSVRTECALFRLQSRVVACGFTKQNADIRWVVDNEGAGGAREDRSAGSRRVAASGRETGQAGTVEAAEILPVLVFAPLLVGPAQRCAYPQPPEFATPAQSINPIEPGSANAHSRPWQRDHHVAHADHFFSSRFF